MRTNASAALAAAATIAFFSKPMAPAAARCSSCQPASRTVVKTNYNYKTVQQVHNVTKYKDVNSVRNVTQVRHVEKANYVNVVHRTVNVTRVQPVTHVNVVTRVHPVTHVNVVTQVTHRTVYQHSNQSVSQVVNVGGRTVYSSSTVSMPGRTVTTSRIVHVSGGSNNVNCGC